VVYARHLAMYVSRKVLPRNSLAGIGRAFEQDHGTVLNAIQRVQDLIDTNDAQLKRDLAKVEAAVRAAMKDGRL
jgi:chromosomal replication initiation ATPase DnaA